LTPFCFLFILMKKNIMWVIVKMVKHHTGVELPVILVDSYSEIMSFETEEDALKMKEIFEANSDSGHKYLIKKQ